MIDTLVTWGLILCLGFAVGRFSKRSAPRRCPDPDPGLERGIRAIIRITDELMGPAKRWMGSGRPPEQCYVTVRYSDLLRIWDTAERMKWMV